MSFWLQHLPVLPIIIPLVAGAAMLLLADTNRYARGGIALVSTLAQLAAAISLLFVAGGGVPGVWENGVGVYLVGDWPAPFGIVLVVDRLAAVMLTLTAVLGLATLVYALARWDRAGVHFHSLFQFLLMGLNGAFLTGDLFNLFVFFEVLLAASYGLLLHGSGVARVSAGLQYIAVNLVASFLLLISIALIYGVTGTLNMADLALRAGNLTGAERMLFEAGAAILGVAFLVKAGAWPLNFWLVKGYGSAGAPIAAMFSIMTKVGIYALLRIGSLLLPTGAPAAFSLDWMFAAGLATLLFGALGLLATQQLEKMVGYCVIVSAGTLLTALGMPGVTLTGPALFYLISSVLTTGAFFLLAELIERTRSFGANVLAVTLDAFDLDDPTSVNRSDDVVGVAIPAAMAFLGLAFISCALLVTGLPPLSGFVAKFSLLSAAVSAATESAPPMDAWILVAAVLVSGLAGLIGLGRTGIRIFWASDDRSTPRLRVIEAGPVAALVLLCVALAAGAGPVSAYLDDAARSLDQPASYIDAVMSAQTVRGVKGGS
ncbi:monovalent cation/H+ antiporter subunit D [Achromobacter mucicolens]|uniref:monovalent cation/H+ antiporter subunit D n=1 Tax=Achromobacter TaxID=222 RepID=UPI00146684FF|nr:MULTISPECIES: monovalent cation/H+ antiporter subunit D [Achromobacter]MCP2513621.1 monovalent cation/H+ antiporter subunit D [Achromobacter mucicolens]MDI6947954.1 monovalent cation/H+ antiporter subunit D [Serratia sp. Se-RSmG]WGJ92898.1 monovalent cation/H+ antiporter subunit D [Achromobacter mucicolens]CAB3826716.1 Na(+)/H(+) antiporter subunit D [Achromobacter mucicolens]